MAAEKIVPLEKQSRKAQRRYYSARRNDWNGIAPVTRIVPNKKKQVPRKERFLPDED